MAIAVNPLKPAERRNGTHRVAERWPDMTGTAVSPRTHRLFLRDDPQRRKRTALDIHLSRRRERHVRLSRQPAPGFWQQPVGALCTVVLMTGLIVAMFVAMFVVGSQGPIWGTP